MINRDKIKKVVVIGSGISGASAAYELAKTLNIPPKHITVLEKNSEVGGEVKNFSHPFYPNLITPLGAGVLAHNYPVLDVVKEKNIQLETILPTNSNTVEISKELKNRSLFGKFTYISDFLWQNVKFAKHVWQFNHACQNLSSTPPQDFEMNFEDFQQKYKLDKIKTFMTFLWPGFGYGMFDEKESYAHRFFSYMGYSTILGIASSRGLVSVKGGYQHLLTKMLEDFDVQTSVEIKKIQRDQDGVKVNFSKDGKEQILDADLLVLATNPYSYNNLGMALTEAEKECAVNVSSRPYATAAVRIQGAKPEQLFFPNALNQQGFRHPSFLYTLDNRKLDGHNDGRFCTVYINLAKDDVNVTFAPGSKEREDLEYDLKKFLNVSEVIVDKIQIWPHYNPTVPLATGRKLQKDELSNGLNTLHVGAFLPGSFETVGGANNYAINAVHRYLNEPISACKQIVNNVKRSLYFFTVPKAKPFCDSDKEMLDANQSAIRSMKQ